MTFNFGHKCTTNVSNANHLSMKHINQVTRVNKQNTSLPQFQFTGPDVCIK